MNIILVSPAATQSTNGNYTTAMRWKLILQKLGHRVHLTQDYHEGEYDLMIALHAWRSASAINLFKSLFPTKPLIVALTGTDAYQFIHSHPQQTIQSIQLADYLVGLHKLIANPIPEKYKHKVNVILQASTLKPIRSKKIKKNFTVCVAGHLRDEKDPLRTAHATRLLPSYSNITITHFGKAHNKQWEHKARLENSANRRYHWAGEISPTMLRIKFSQVKLMVLSSRMEGGANIISEAVMSDVPVIASNIEGSVGLLGADYHGYYEVGNTQQLKNILLRCEHDNKFYQTLIYQCRARQYLFTQHKEMHAWKKLLAKLSIK